MEIEGWTSEKAKKLDDLSRERRLLKSDFPENYPLCPFNGHILSFSDFDYLGVKWKKGEVLFDIDLRGIVKTPHDEDSFNYFFGFFSIIKGIGHIIRQVMDTEETFTAAFFDGKYCYLYEKIGYYIPAVEE